MTTFTYVEFSRLFLYCLNQLNERRKIIAEIGKKTTKDAIFPLLCIIPALKIGINPHNTPSQTLKLNPMPV